MDSKLLQIHPKDGKQHRANLNLIRGVDFQHNNRIQRIPYLKGTHKIGFPAAKVQLFREPARGLAFFLFGRVVAAMSFIVLFA